MQSKSIIDYCNKLILAPMVRGSLLPMRLLALKYGADLVYTDEIIDHSMLLSTRRVNDILGTVDYVNEENAYVLFRTSPIEKPKLVFQIGTADATRALKVAKMVQNDVSAIDINMGCPKAYSTSLGIGAALLSNVDNAKRIVQSLVENVPLPITCKIRISDDIEKTISMVRDFEKLGVSAVTVHGRTRSQTRSEPVDKDAIRRVAESVQIPIIANGGSLQWINEYSDIEQFKMDCGVTSVMLARIAQENVSIFRKEGKIPADELINEYLKLCIDYDHAWNNVQYSVRWMLTNVWGTKKSPKRKVFEAASSLQEICDLFDLGDYCRTKKSEYEAKGLHSLSVSPLGGSKTPIDILLAREKAFNEKNIFHERMHYKRRFFDNDTVPKLVLHSHCGRNKMPLPVYECERKDRQYACILTHDGKQYSSVYWQDSAKKSKQAAALVCCYHLRLYEEEFLLSIGCLHKR